MEQYISKSALVAEIDKLKGKISDGSSYCNCWQHAFSILELSLYTIEVILPNGKEMISFDALKAFKAGAEWKKDQMMANAINTEASLTMSVPSICISLPLGVNVGDKVKVIVIKED